MIDEASRVKKMKDNTKEKLLIIMIDNAGRIKNMKDNTNKNY